MPASWREELLRSHKLAVRVKLSGAEHGFPDVDVRTGLSATCPPATSTLGVQVDHNVWGDKSIFCCSLFRNVLSLRSSAFLLLC